MFAERVAMTGNIHPLLVLCFMATLNCCTHVSQPTDLVAGGEYPLSDGANLPDAKVGILRWGYLSNELRIDGAQVVPWRIGKGQPAYELPEGKIAYSARLLPGVHHLFIDDSGNRRNIAEFELLVKAGHEYHIHTSYSYRSDVGWIWIIDKVTGEEVARA